MSKKIVLFALATLILAAVHLADAQQAAVCNAVHNAIGVGMQTVPLTLEMVRKAINTLTFPSPWKGED